MVRAAYLLLPLFLLGGCFFESYRPVREFDLTCPEIKNEKNIRLQEFRNNSTSGRRMQLRAASGELSRDPYCQWALPPGELIPRAINRALKNSGTAVEKVSGSICCFEVDREKKVLELSGEFSLNGISRSFSVTEPVSALNAESVVQAANRAVGKLAEEILAAGDAQVK